MNTLMFETKFLLSQNSHVVLVGHSNLHLTHGSTQIRYVNLNDSSVNLFNDKWNINWVQGFLTLFTLVFLL